MKLLRIISQSEEQTQKIAYTFARALLRIPPPQNAVVIGLKGGLGSGKTTFVKGFAKGLGIKKIIQSPTFLLVKNYNLPATSYTLRVSRYKSLYHIDAYRLKSGRDLIHLGWDEWAQSPRNIILIEWAERVKGILSRHRVEIKFQHVDKNKRKLSFYTF